MSITTEHRGYKIRFNEDGETWSCSDLEISCVPKLASIKARIDKLEAASRKMKLCALHIDYHRNVEAVTVTLLCEPETGYRDTVATVKKCWVINSKGDREKVHLDQLYPLDSQADVTAWLKMEERAKQARDVADAAFGTLTAYNADTLMLAAKENEAED